MRLWCFLNQILLAMANGNVDDSQLPDTAPIDEVEFAKGTDNHWGKIIKLSLNGHSTSVLTETSYRAGRSPSCELSIDDSDMEANDLIKISKVHFKLERAIVENRQFVYLEDLSSNGTYVNEKKVEKNTRVVLQSAAQISLATPALKMYLFIDTSRCPGDNWLHFSLAGQFDILKSLGKGTYGDVKLVIDQKTYERYAMKKIMKNKMSEKKILNEVNILKRLEHPVITLLEEVYDTPEAVFITLEYISGGNLLNRINKFNILPEKESKGIFYQLLMGVNYLHKQGITHRDLKPENILVQVIEDSQYILVKITDFGLSKIEEGTDLKTICGTMKYMAPEVLAHSISTYDNKVDIWSLGVILFVCLSGEHPFPKRDNTRELALQIMKGKYKFPEKVWQSISFEAMHLIKKILVVDPEKRIPLVNLFSHKWLNDDDMKDAIHFLISEKSVEDLEPVLKKQKLR